MNKINKKKVRASIFNPLITALIILMIILSFITGIVTIGRISITSKEAIKIEAEAGNELIRIYISIDEKYENSNIVTTYTTILNTTTSIITTNTSTINKKYETRITITNQWGKTSVIDYFVIEDWNGEIISKGRLNIVLEAGEEIVLKGNDILSTFKLNDSKYAEDFWFFKNKIRCITLHTILGNTFGSAYYPVRKITKTAEREIVSYYYTTLIETINQTFATTFYGSYTLKIESHGPFQISPRDDNPKWYKIHEYDDQSNDEHYHDVWGDGIQPNSDPYGRRYDDGEYVYPAGILLTISHSFRSFPCSWKWDKIYVTNGYNYIGPYGKLYMYVTKMELWELDQFGNEVRKILETTSNSISFAMFGNYKLKRYFGYSTSPYNPPTTTITYTITQTTTSYSREERTGYVYWKAVRKDEKNQQNILIKLADSGWWIEIVSYKYDTHGNGNAWWGDKNSGPNQYAVWIYAYCHFTSDDPDAYIEFWMYYKEYRYIPA
ncbi:MAG: hypothetical protein QXY18_02995 [Nitrososphaerota archaeon]